MPDEATWQEIERAYVGSDETLSKIAARFGVAFTLARDATAGRDALPTRREPSDQLQLARASPTFAPPSSTNCTAG